MGLKAAACLGMDICGTPHQGGSSSFRSFIQGLGSSSFGTLGISGTVRDMMVSVKDVPCQIGLVRKEACAMDAGVPVGEKPPPQSGRRIERVH
jgi:hypothetical protein